MNQLDLQGRHAVITGGAVGLGFAIAQRMQASGAQVTLGRQAAARDELARLDQRAELVGNLAVQALGFYGLQGHEGEF